MDEDDHRRAEEEMNALSLRHLQRLKESQKFVNRLTALLYKLMVICLLVGLASVFSSQFPSQFPSFVRYVRRIIFSRTWDVVNVLLVAFAISYGVLARGALQNNGETEGGGGGGEIGGDAKFFDYESVNRRRDEQLSNAEENQAQSEAVESSIPAQMRRSRRNSYSYQDLSEAGRGGGDSNPRRAMDDTDWIRRSRRGSEDSAPKANGVPDFGMKLNGSEDSDKNSSGLKDYARDDATISSGFETPWQSEKPTSPPETEVKLSESSNFDFSAHIKYNVSTEEHRSRHPLAPPAPPPYPPPPPPRPPPPPPPPPPEKDSNPAPYQSEKRKSRPPSPPPPPPRPPPALETHLPKQRIRDTSDVSPHHRQDKSEKPKKMEKIKSDKKAPKIPAIITIPIPPIPPPLPTEILQHESRHRSSRSKEDSKHRSSRSKEESKDRSTKSKEDSKDRSSKDEHKQSRAAKDIANVLGLLSPSERKQKKIPSPPAPPPVPSTQPGLLSPSERKHKKIPSPPAPPPPPSTLQQWFSSYKRESKHKSKDSEHSPRHRSDKSRRKVHSSSSPPPPPPPPPAHIYTVDPKYHKRRTSEKRDIPKPPIYSTDSNYQRNVTSEKIEIPKTPVYSADPKYQRNGASEENDMPKPRRDETSGNGDTFEYRKETVNVDTKVEEKEKLPERISSSIPLPPPPPPPFPMVEHQWPLYDDLRLQKRISSSSAELAESVPEPEPESEPEPERGWAFCFRKQFSLDNADSQFCPSPSPDEVNRKADAFIAKMRQQMRLQ